MESLLKNEIYITILAGGNKQEMQMEIKLQQRSTFLLSESCSQNKKAKKFNEKNSTT